MNVKAERARRNFPLEPQASTSNSETTPLATLSADGVMTRVLEAGHMTGSDARAPDTKEVADRLETDFSDEGAEL